MPIPPLTDLGFLPPGVHGATLGELRERFGSFQESDRRLHLFARLKELVTALRESGRFVAVVVDGSFVTAKPKPDDIDIVIALPIRHDWSEDLIPAVYALVARNALRRRYGFDAFVATDQGADYARYVEFFSRVRDRPHVRKGMLRITL